MSAAYCRVHKTTTTALSASTHVALAFDAEDSDVSNLHDPVTNPSRITIRTPGRYAITGGFGIAVPTTGETWVTIRKNGGTDIAVQTSGTQGVEAYLSTSCVAELVAGDYIELCAISQFEATVGNGNYSPHLELVRIVGGGQDVFCPMDYGAVGDGVTNDGPAIRACLVAARAWACPTVESRQFNVPVVDLAGRCYATDIQIEVPGGQGMLIQNGSLKAGAGFTSSLYLLHIGSTADPAMADGYRNVNTTIRNLYFDANRAGGCMFVEKFMRLCIDRCLFAHYATVGLKTSTDSHDGHQLPVR